MRDLYDILDVPKTSSEAEIKSAYRKLAKAYHPDHNAGRPHIAEKFKEVSAAYAILGDAKQRRRYDHGEIDESGNERAPQGNTGPMGGGPFRSAGANTEFDFEEAQNAFSDFFRFSGRGDKAKANTGRRGPGTRSGLDITYEVTIAFEEAVNGATRRLRLNDGREVDIKVPAGIQDGQIIRLAGQGGPGFAGGKSGDALVQVNVAKHPYFRREGLDIHLELPISVDEAVLGGDIEVPTPRGRLTVRVPKGSSTGRRLRLRDKGVRRKDNVGNLYVTLKIMLPKQRDPKLEAAMKAALDARGSGYGAKLRDQAGLK